MRLFIIDGPSCGYGCTCYVLAYAETLDEAKAKVCAKYSPGYVGGDELKQPTNWAEAIEYAKAVANRPLKYIVKDDEINYPDCEVVFDDDGISCIIGSEW